MPLDAMERSGSVERHWKQQSCHREGRNVLAKGLLEMARWPGERSRLARSAFPRFKTAPRRTSKRDRSSGVADILKGKESMCLLLLYRVNSGK